MGSDTNAERLNVHGHSNAPVLKCEIARTFNSWNVSGTLRVEVRTSSSKFALRIHGMNYEHGIQP